VGYDVYDRETGNLVDSFPTQQQALAMVRRVIEASGKDAVASWVVGPNDHDGEVSSGKALIDRAMAARV
jgi:hypothetical protein